MPIPTRPGRNRAGIWFGVIGIATLTAVLIYSNATSSTDEPPTLEPEARIDTPPATPTVQPEDDPVKVPMDVAIVQASAQVTRAASMAAQGLPTVAPRTRDATAPRKKPPVAEDETVKQPKKIKKNIDWLYKK